MKKQLATMILAASALAPKAFADDQKSVIFEDTYLERGYTAFGARSANLLGERQAFAGVLGGWHFSDKVTFGIRADALVSHVDTEVEGADRLGVTQLGLFGEYDVYSKDLVSVTASLAGGSGDIGYKVEGEPAAMTAATAEEDEYRHDAFTYIEPELTAALHVSHRVDLALSFGFRRVKGVSLEGVPPSSMDGGTAAFMMRGNF